MLYICKRCICRKYGLECTSGSGECRGIGCSNSTFVHKDDLGQFLHLVLEFLGPFVFSLSKPDKAV